jgi:hypothetical protein
MPANPRDNQIVTTVGGDDLFPVSLRGEGDRDDKTAGYVDRTWYISFDDLVAAVAEALPEDELIIEGGGGGGED